MRLLPLARISLLPLILLLLSTLPSVSAEPAVEPAVVSREACTLSTFSFLLYVSGMSPASPTSAHCERCIAASEANHIHTNEADSYFSFQDDSTRSCLALYIASALAARVICKDCTKEVATLSASPRGCSEPLQSAINLVYAGCQALQIKSDIPVADARNACLAAIPDVFDEYALEGTSCEKNISAAASAAAAHAGVPLEGLSSSALLNRTVDEAIFDVENLDLADLNAVISLAGCYVFKQADLASRDHTPFCDCLKRDRGTGGNAKAGGGSPQLLAAQRIFSATKNGFAIQLLMNSALRAILNDASQCFGEDASFLVDRAEDADQDEPPSPSPERPPYLKEFNLPEKNPTCFPGAATVQLRDGSLVSMAELSVGDEVRVGKSQFSAVFMFTHRLPGVAAEFVEVTMTSGRRVSMTPGHGVYVEGGVVSAGTVKVGDSVESGAGGWEVVAAVRRVGGEGLYNPQTMDGRIVVDGVMASTYTAAVKGHIAHAALAPLRAAYRYLGLDIGRLLDGQSQFGERLRGFAVPIGA